VTKAVGKSKLAAFDAAGDISSTQYDSMKMTGIVEVAAFAACAAGGVNAAITDT
jgi:hypothetical protein